MKVVAYSVGPMANNTYVVVDEATSEAAIVDPSYDSAPLWETIQRSGWRLVWVLNTHGHFDHVVENALFMERSGAPLAIHADDAPLLAALETQAGWFGVDAPAPSHPDRLLEDGDTVAIGRGVLRVAHTPGHSPGGVCFLCDGWAIVGDVLFAGSVGRVDLPGGSMPQLLTSIEQRLLSLPDDTIVYPGHGPATTIGAERRGNIYLGGLS